MEKRDSFVFYKEWKDAIADLPNDVRLEIYEGAIEYALTGSCPVLKPIANIAFNFIKNDIDRNREKFDAIKKARSEAGKKHKGNQHQVWNKLEQMEQIGTNGTVNVSVNENVNVKKKVLKEKSDANGDAVVDTPSNTSTTLFEEKTQKYSHFWQECQQFVGYYSEVTIKKFFDYWTNPIKEDGVTPRYSTKKGFNVRTAMDEWVSHSANQQDRQKQAEDASKEKQKENKRLAEESFAMLKQSGRYTKEELWTLKEKIELRYGGVTIDF